MEGSNRIEAVRGRELLREWFAARTVSSVEFSEVLEPEVDPSDDYVVAYEAAFEPRELDRPHIEVWITDEGCVAFGFERRARVQARLGKRTWHGGFAAGALLRSLH